MAEEDEPKGMVLWGGVDVDVSLPQLKQHRCAVCRKPAAYASRDLAKQERVFLCARCSSGRVGGRSTGGKRPTESSGPDGRKGMG